MVVTGPLALLIILARNEALEFLKPVLHKDEFGDRLRFTIREFGHKEMPAIEEYVPVADGARWAYS